MDLSEARKLKTLDRRSFLRTGAIAGTALVASASAMAQHVAAADDSDRGLTKGDIAILRLLAAVELIESDLWLQYAELGGVMRRRNGLMAWSIMGMLLS
jgi:hypothetical protein